VWSAPRHGPQTRQVDLSSFGWRRFYLSLISENVPICSRSEALEPGRSFFRLDPVEMATAVAIHLMK